MGLKGWTGVHPVGVADVEWAANGLRNVKDGNPDEALPRDTETAREGEGGSAAAKAHVVGRLFYPCNPEKATKSGTQAKRGVAWLSAWQEATGYVSFMFFMAKSIKAAVAKQLLRFALWIVGLTQRLPLYKGAAVEGESGPHPAIIFSHGLGGNRGTYAVLCSELASQGYVVLALEHTDGTASSVHLAGTGGWRYYSGMGQGDAKFDKVRYRQREIATAERLLHALCEGSVHSDCCGISGVDHPATFLQGKLDMRRLAAVGHSFGGATVGCVAAKPSPFRAVVALDPWWLGVPPDEPLLDSWQSRTPLLIIGSHAWNKPYDEAGNIVCGRQQQEAILAAVKVHNVSQHELAGGGALLLAIENSTHDTFSDLPVLFATRFSWLLSKLGFDTKLDPVVGMAAVASATALFLHRHLPTKTAPSLPPLNPDVSISASRSSSGSDIEQGGDEPRIGDTTKSGGHAGGSDAKGGSTLATANGVARSDSGWSLVSAGDGGDEAGHDVEGPSEASRTDAANLRRSGSLPLDPMAGSEADAGRDPDQGGPSQDMAVGNSSVAAGISQAVGSDSRGGLFLPSVAELGSAGKDASNAPPAVGPAIASQENADGAGTADRTAQWDLPAAEDSKIPLSKDTQEAVRQLLGSLACILELSV